MRHAAITAFLLLAACGGGTGSSTSNGNLTSAFEQGFRSSYRTKFVGSCVTSANAAAAQSGSPMAPVQDFPKLCGCAADRLLATKSISELMSGPPQSEQMAVMQACVASGGEAPAPVQPDPLPSARPSGLKGLHDI